MSTEGQRRSKRQEKRLAADVGGRRTAGSGNGWAVKNDVRNDRWSIEAKTTERRSYSLRLDALKQAEKHALLDGREMAFCVEIAGESFVVVTYDTFRHLFPQE
jgi:hypothetical protein